MRKPFVLLIRNERFWLVGSFAHRDAAGEWGARTQLRKNDDPRWQVLELTQADLQVPPKVFFPEAPEAAENGEPDNLEV